MLEILTFTGVDQKTDLGALAEITAQYPKVEFGILVGSQTGTTNPLFPPWSTIYEFKRTPGINRSLHLCGHHAREAAGEQPYGQSLQLLCNGFDRIQVNLHGDEVNPNRIDLQSNAIKCFAAKTAVNSVILQHRGPWDTVPAQHPRIEYLFDLSEGSGQESFGAWPIPPTGKRAGYAGGIGPHNIGRAMEFIDEHPTATLWLDMEGNIRTPDHWLDRWLDLDKVRAVCELAFDNRRS